MEPAREIAGRVDLEPAGAESILKAMSRKGMIRARPSKDGLVFSLMPFIVGIYEEQLPCMDEELALLFEKYIQQTDGGVGMVAQEPALHRVIPVGEAIPFEVEIFPYERATELVESAKAWGLRDCICRVQQKMAGKGCEHPIDNCILIAPIKGAFDKSNVTKAISKEEALEKLRQAEDTGLVHSSANHQEQIYYICNCCTCCCGVLRGLSEFGHRSSIARSGFLGDINEEVCTGCAACVDRCHFGAISESGDVCSVDHQICVGCGLCVSACTEDAIGLRRRPADENFPPPLDGKEWMEQRASKRGISLGDII
jgi:ferredoxin